MIERRRAAMTVSEDRRGRSGSERRLTPRYPAGGTSVVLTWTEDNNFRSVGASLRDISQGGGSGMAEDAPAPGTVLWFRLTGDDTTPWIGATVIGVSKSGFLGRGPRLVRWQFRESCPYEVFKAAIEGFNVDVHANDPGYNYRDR